MRISQRFLLCLGTTVFFSVASFGGAILPGFTTTSDGRNDDGTYTTGGCTNPNSAGTCPGTKVPVGFSLNFFGLSFNSVYVNTNGNLTLDSPLSTFTPFGLTATNRQIFAPFFGDVDTRNTASGVTTFGSTPGTFTCDAAEGCNATRNAFGVDWINVGYFNQHVDKTNSFQAILVDRSDTGAGNFDIIFNYDQVQWETGDASGGTGGLGGGTNAARVGYSNGSGAPNTSFELPGSATPGSLLNGGPNALISHSLNSNVAGRYIFFARNGQITGGTPEPGTFLLVGLSSAFLFWRRRKQSA